MSARSKFFSDDPSMINNTDSYNANDIVISGISGKILHLVLLHLFLTKTNLSPTSFDFEFIQIHSEHFFLDGQLELHDENNSTTQKKQQNL